MQQWEQDQAIWEKDKGASEKPVKPNPRDYFVGRGTLEGWLRTHSLDTNKTGMIAIKDELRGLFNSLGQYKGGKGDDRDILLSLWNGKCDKLNNVNNDSRIFIEKTAISIVGGIQEIELVKTMGDRSDPDGLFGRFLWVNPPNVPDRWVDKEIDISPMLEDLYRNLDKLPQTQLTLDAESKSLYKTFVNWQADEKENANDALKNVLSKLKGYVGRLAGLLHCIDYAFDTSIGWSDVIDCDTVFRAMELCFHYYGQIKLIHSKTTYAELPPEYLRIVELGTQKGEVSDRTICLKKWVGKVEEARELLQEIARLGHGRIKNTGRHGITLIFESQLEPTQDFSAEIDSWGILEDIEVVDFPDPPNDDSLVGSILRGGNTHSFTKQPQDYIQQELEPLTQVSQDSQNSDNFPSDLDNQSLHSCPDCKHLSNNCCLQYAIAFEDSETEYISDCSGFEFVNKDGKNTNKGGKGS